ncbi:MAG: hypothetical protein J7K61_04800 [Thermoplasmata archaeon]|nr:hypothetical protein [Thermoplasmata archaeon]
MYEGWFITEAILSFWRRASRKKKLLIIGTILAVLLLITLTILYNWIAFNS